MKPLLCSPNSTHQIRSWELYPLLGFTSVIPKDYSTETLINGVRVRVEPGKGSYAKHRIRLLCTCGQWVPYGRQVQHMHGRIHALAC
jgi:hypothetical protein